jgi:adenylate cyclase
MPRYWEIAAVLALGAAVSLLTATRGPAITFLSTIGVMLLYAALNTLVIFRRDVWMIVAAALITAFLVWAFVTLFRQLTAERERRIFAQHLRQYTSPAIAERIAEDPGAAQAFKSVQSRDITCLFTDLAGFTSISEQEDAETVQYVLNTYLERMAEVVWARRGLLNKFMGDGIMAFFNPSVDPQPDHARIACEVTLDSFDALEKLKAEQAGGPAGRVFERLGMRAGLATGMCKNGDFGSELKADYTVIGDVVNLAARLEPANKVFGTSILVSGETRARVQDLFEFRYLAELQVKGKARTVPVFEIVCRKGALTPERREYIERFEAGVALYKAQRWDECMMHFTRLLARNPDDPGADRYINACQELKSFPPEDGWSGALELKEK